MLRLPLSLVSSAHCSAASVAGAARRLLELVLIVVSRPAGVSICLLPFAREYNGLGCWVATDSITLQAANRLSRQEELQPTPGSVPGHYFHCTPSVRHTRPRRELSEAGLQSWLTCTDVGDEVCNVLLLEELGEQVGPVRLHCHAGCLYERLDVVSLQ